MFRVLLITVCAGFLTITAAKAENLALIHGPSGFELGTRLSNRIDTRVPSIQKKTEPTDDGAAGEVGAVKKPPIRKVRIIYPAQ